MRRVAALAAVALVAAGCGSQRAAPRSELVGRSVEGRAIRAVVRGEGDVRVLVVGCIHGNETAGIPIVRRLATLPPPQGVELWLVADANPDGVAARKRTNARGVDLNRNFPWRWRLAAGGTRFFSGPRALSEPESRALARLIRRVRPRLTIWFHQPYAVVDESGGDVALEREYARRVGLPLKRLRRFGGGATGWENATFPGTTAFVVELPWGRPTPRVVERHARAVLALAGRVRGTAAPSPSGP